MPLSLVDGFCFAFFLLQIQCSSGFINWISHAVQRFVVLFSSVGKCDAVIVPWEGWCSTLGYYPQPDWGPQSGTHGGASWQNVWQLPRGEGCLGVHILLLCSPPCGCSACTQLNPLNMLT